MLPQLDSAFLCLNPFLSLILWWYYCSLPQPFLFLSASPFVIPYQPLQDVFCLTFSVEMDYFGELRTIPLRPNGETIPVTEENRHEYVELMVDYLMYR